MPYEDFPSPCFVLFEEALEANLQLLNLVQKEAGISIVCALKGFAFWRAFPLIRQYLSGATASSLNEAQLIVDDMQCEAHTYAPAYLEEEFETLLYYSSHLTFNSLSQWTRFREKALACPKKISFGLRVDPE
jgi:carboxynorspermidine decarboxylase